MDAEVWVALGGVVITVIINVALISYKFGKITSEIKSMSEKTDLRFEFRDANHSEINKTLSELKKTVSRLGNELSKLLGQLEGDNHGQNSNPEH